MFHMQQYVHSAALTGYFTVIACFTYFFTFLRERFGSCYFNIEILYSGVLNTYYNMVVVMFMLICSN